MSTNPYEAPQHLDEIPEHSKERPGVALTLGILGMFAWMLPVVGVPIAITGLVFGRKASRGTKPGIALAAVILCSISLSLAALNMAAGLYLGLIGPVGQKALINKLGLGPPVK